MLEQVIDILVDFTGIDKSKVTSESNLVADLELNSLDVVNLIVEFEENFDIEIPDRVLKDLTTVNDIVNYLEQNT